MAWCQKWKKNYIKLSANLTLRIHFWTWLLLVFPLIIENYLNNVQKYLILRNLESQMLNSTTCQNSKTSFQETLVKRGFFEVKYTFCTFVVTVLKRWTSLLIAIILKIFSKVFFGDTKLKKAIFNTNLKFCTLVHTEEILRTVRVLKQ